MWDHCSIIAWRAVQSLRTIIEMVPTLFYLLIFQGDRKVYISHEMKKQLFLLLFVLLVTGCSDDLPSSDYLGGDVKPKKLVSKILITDIDSKLNDTWTFEYDMQNRISKTLYEWGNHYEASYITYEGNKVIQEIQDGWYNDKYSPKPNINHLYYYLGSDGNTEVMSNYDMLDSKSTKANTSTSTAYMTYDKEGYLTYVDSKNYDGENKTVYWKDNDIKQIKYNENGPSVYWEYGKQINNPYANIDFNYFLNSNELCRHFIDSDCLKAFGFFGKRGKHLKTKESYNIDSEKYISYEYVFDKEGYVIEIIETAKDGGNDLIYKIQYIDIK